MFIPEEERPGWGVFVFREWFKWSGSGSSTNDKIYGNVNKYLDIEFSISEGGNNIQFQREVLYGVFMYEVLYEVFVYEWYAIHCILAIKTSSRSSAVCYLLLVNDPEEAEGVLLGRGWWSKWEMGKQPRPETEMFALDHSPSIIFSHQCCSLCPRSAVHCPPPSPRRLCPVFSLSFSKTWCQF